MFRSSDYVAAQLPWQVELGGRVFTGRLVSHLQLQQYNARVEWAAASPAKLSADPAIREAIEARLLYRALRWLFRQAFPWRPWMLWRGDPVRLLFDLPTDALRMARDDFFASLARSNATTEPAARGSSAPPSGS